MEKHLVREPRRVFIPADFGHQQGWFFRQLGIRSEHLKGFLIALNGYLNPMMCQSCMQRFLMTLSSSDEHVMSPFYSCVSIPGFMKSACSNCVWHGGAKHCSYAKLPGYIWNKRSDRSGQDNPFLEWIGKGVGGTSYSGLEEEDSLARSERLDSLALTWFVGGEPEESVKRLRSKLLSGRLGQI